MAEGREERQRSAESEGEDRERPFGGEVPVGGGSMPRFLRWITYLLFIWAITYLLVHPRLDEDWEIVLVFAGLLMAWLLFFTITKRPSDL